MKTLLQNIAIVLLAMLSVPMLGAQEPKGADIEFQSSVVDLGVVAQEGGKQMVRLSFTNTGDVPLVVTEVRTSGVITVTLDPSKAPKGQYYRVMQIFSTATSGVKRITVKAVIE